MAQAIPRQQVLRALQRRYDYQSAEVVFKHAVASVKLREQEQYTTEQLHAIRDGLQKIGDRLEPVLAELTALAGPTALAEPAATVVSVTPPSIPNLPMAKPSDDDVAGVIAPEQPPATAASVEATDEDTAAADEATGEEPATESSEGEPAETQSETKSGRGRRRRG